MPESYNNITPENDINVQSDAPKIVDTSNGAKDGQNKCPKCGSTDILLNQNTGHLRCNFCRYEFDPEKVVGLEDDINNLSGQIIGSGAQDISASTDDILTLKCSSCGSEVVIDTSEVLQARCHWCRNFLSINEQIPNGSVPDMILPFVIKKEEARFEIEKFVKKRKFYANNKFRKEFTTENIMGVYFPYMVVDINANVNLVGQGEHLIRRYTRKSGDRERTYYDADLYDVQRKFDIIIDDLTIESSSDKLDKKASDKTTNVINAIMPFDIENSVKWNANYLRGYSSEKRDTNIEQLRPIVEAQSKDISRFAANDSLQEYDRGVAWSEENLSIKGEQWKAAYLPVWLYSYQQVKGNKKILHYVAVNARTKETMGSVPINKKKLFLISSLIEMTGFYGMINIEFENNWILLLPGIVYYIVIYLKYRNLDARHHHESETKRKISNLVKYDKFVETRKGLSNSKIRGANNKSISGQSVSEKLISDIKRQI